MTRPLTRPGSTALSILAYVKSYKTESGGDSPTIRAIAAYLGIESTNTVHVHLRTLEKFGLIELSDHHAHRRIRVVGGEWRMKEEAQ